MGLKYNRKDDHYKLKWSYGLELFSLIFPGSIICEHIKLNKLLATDSVNSE